MNDSAFGSDFDGTITDLDVYALIAERYMPTDHPDYFADYLAGHVTHFEAMAAFFHYAATEAHACVLLMLDKKHKAVPDACDHCLEANSWDLIIVSAGSS